MLFFVIVKSGLVLTLFFVVTFYLRSRNWTQDLTTYEGKVGNTLELLQVIHRHGERTPLDSYANDPYRDGSKWPQGLGKITNLGKQQMYELGQFLRSRYRGFLNFTYHDDSVYVRSSDRSRTLMSAQVLLAALYPPDDSQLWNPELKWQPIPVHTVPQPEDSVLNQQFPCLRYNMEAIRVEMSPEMKRIREENADLYTYLQNLSGDPIKTLKDISDFHDKLLCEQHLGLKLPEWTIGVYPEKTGPLQSMHFFYRTYTLEMKRIKAGPLLYEIAEHFRAFSNGTLDPPRRQLFLYSAHDSCMTSLMHLLDVFWPHVPPTAAALMLELHSHPVHDHVIKIFYRNDTTKEPYLLSIPNCSPDCTLMQFLNLSAPLVVQDLSKECRL